MAEFSDTAFVAGRLGKAQLFAVKLAPLFELFAGAFETEAALRRPFCGCRLRLAPVLFFIYTRTASLRSG
jgi:hypothetical protein